MVTGNNVSETAPDTCNVSSIHYRQLLIDILEYFNYVPMHGLDKPKGMGKLPAENQLVTRTNFSLFSAANLLDPEECKILSKVRSFKCQNILLCLSFWWSLNIF